MKTITVLIHTTNNYIIIIIIIFIIVIRYPLENDCLNDVLTSDYYYYIAVHYTCCRIGSSHAAAVGVVARNTIKYNMYVYTTLVKRFVALLRISNELIIYIQWT